MPGEVDRQRCQDIAAGINTGEADAETSRALVVFNFTDIVLSGVAVFHAAMSWRSRSPVPPVVVSDWSGSLAISEAADVQYQDNAVSFDLRFAVAEVPPQGWKTYLAAYADAPVSNEAAALALETPGLVVVETTRHGGDLASEGNFCDITNVLMV